MYFLKCPKQEISYNKLADTIIVRKFSYQFLMFAYIKAVVVNCTRRIPSGEVHEH